MNTEKFISDLEKICEKKNITLFLPKKRTIDYDEDSNLQVSGYFSDAKRLLAVACGKKKQDYMSIMIHESCHLDQFLQKSILWDRLDANGVSCLDAIDEWINGKDISLRKISNYIKRAIDVELDCEIRAVKKIKRYKIDIDTKEYIQKANSYILFYNYILKNRTWYLKGREPYMNKKLWSQMPDTFLKNYYNNFDYNHLYDKYCFDKISNL